MKITLKEIPVREIAEGYKDNEEEGVIGYNGKLNIRPAYQREFVYKDKQRDAVIETVQQGFPLNSIYFAVNDNGTYELLDGQQRIISLCQYITGGFSLDSRFFYNLLEEEKEQILDYMLLVYVCEGKHKEKLDWFRVINIAGLVLTNQELRNATYTGPWLTNAKQRFSKRNCPAEDIARNYLKGSAIRQDYLETAISWISKDKIEDYMGRHQHDTNADSLWLYFQAVINWVRVVFTVDRKEMQGINWGFLYNQLKDKSFDSTKIEEHVFKLRNDEDVTNQRGIYYYVLLADEKYLNIRTFSDIQKHRKYDEQAGICLICKGHFDLKDMEADHITPWCGGGKTLAENCQMLCKKCNREKSSK